MFSVTARLECVHERVDSKFKNLKNIRRQELEQWIDDWWQAYTTDQV
jgi:hypothetical protein